VSLVAHVLASIRAACRLPRSPKVDAEMVDIEPTKDLASTSAFGPADVHWFPGLAVLVIGCYLGGWQFMTISWQSWCLSVENTKRIGLAVSCALQKKTLLNILLGKYEETLRIFETTDPILLGGQLVQYLEFGRLSTKQCQRCVISNCDSSSG